MTNPSYNYRPNVNDIIRSTIIDRINNENYNWYFPVSSDNNPVVKKEKKKKALVILPSRFEEL